MSKYVNNFYIIWLHNVCNTLFAIQLLSEKGFSTSLFQELINFQLKQINKNYNDLNGIAAWKLLRFGKSGNW